MINSENKLKLLANIPFDVDGIRINAKTLKEIAELGEEKHYNYLYHLLLSSKDMKIEDEISTYDILKLLMLNSTDEFKKTIINGLQYFISKDIKFANIDNTAFFYLDKILITSEIYEKIKEVLIYQNCISSEKKEEKKKESERAKKIKEKIEKLKNKVKEIKKKKDLDLTLNDLISSFVSYSKNIDIFNVWNMSLYQFYDQLKRMQIVSDYEISIQSLLHGADANKVKIKHFISKLDDNKN